MTGTVLWWIGSGDGDPALLEGVRRRVASEFGLAAEVARSPERPDGAFDARRNQHSSSRILLWLRERAPREARRLLGLTDADLFIPILTFVFGEAQLSGRAAVVSTARLASPIGFPGTGRRLALRLEKEAVHELGHTFGLLHCHTPRCAMARSASLKDVDAKEPSLCPACRARYLDLATDNGETDEQEEHPDPDRR